MVAMNKFNCFSSDLAAGKHNFGTNTFKVMLSNVAPLATNTLKANLTEIAAQGGYTAGGDITTITTSASGTTLKIKCSNVAWTDATDVNGDIPTFQYVILYNATASGNPLIGWAILAAPLTLQNGDTYDFDFDQTNGAITIG